MAFKKKGKITESVQGKLRRRTVERTELKETRANQHLKLSSKKGIASPSSTYDFTADTPVLNTRSNSSRTKTKRTTGNNNLKKKDVKAGLTDNKKKDVKARLIDNKKKNIKAGLIDIKKKDLKVGVSDNKKKSLKTETPKSRVSKIVCPVVASKPNETPSNKRKRTCVKSVPPLNLSENSFNSKIEKSKNLKERKTNSAKGTVGIANSPAFAPKRKKEEVIESDDSAIFVSPKVGKLKRLKVTQTSTPSEVKRNVAKTDKSKKVKGIDTKVTSTPYDVKSGVPYTGLRPALILISPVQRVDTPTSDYASMDSYLLPSPTPPRETKGRKRASSPTPAFSLEDDTDLMNLNKSVDKSYKRSAGRKKYESSKLRASQIEEWAEKVNSELEDIENFELSVEG